MARKQEQEKRLKVDRSALIEVLESGEPRFSFTGVWKAREFERMLMKAQKALRMEKVRLSQAAEREASEVAETANAGKEEE